MSFVAPALELEHVAAPLAGADVVELQWLDGVLASGRPRALLWQGAQGFVVPRSYRRHARLDAVRERFAGEGWPVWLRRSGGGLVPQGPGLANLSLLYPIDDQPGRVIDDVYRHLSGVLARALAGLGIDATARSVEGSFCDGRYNLAAAGRKIAGTAQYWRRAGERRAVLAHALLLVDADVRTLTLRANDFEQALGSARRYDAGTMTTVARQWGATHRDAVAPIDLADRLCALLALALTAA